MRKIGLGLLFCTMPMIAQIGPPKYRTVTLEDGDTLRVPDLNDVIPNDLRDFPWTPLDPRTIKIGDPEAARATWEATDSSWAKNAFERANLALSFVDSHQIESLSAQVKWSDICDQCTIHGWPRQVAEAQFLDFLERVLEWRLTALARAEHVVVNLRDLREAFGEEADRAFAAWYSWALLTKTRAVSEAESMGRPPARSEFIRKNHGRQTGSAGDLLNSEIDEMIREREMQGPSSQ